MQKTVDHFVEEISSLELMAADDIRAFVAGLQTPDADAATIATSLVRAGKLTTYQAASVCDGQGKSLVFGDYVVLDKIGAGGMGVVLKAEHRRMKRIVAVKVLPAKAVDSDAAIRRFHREVEAAGKLIHVNIVTAFDAGEDRGMHYLVMEYVDGRDLSQILVDAGPLPVERAVECIIQAAHGLDYAHQRGIVHRDIKPSNLLLTTDGTIKILDMGLARLTGESGQHEQIQRTQLTQSGQIMGTVDYMAPEQAMDTSTADHRADVYSLGCTLFRLLTGRNVYEDDTVMKRLLAHQQADIPSLRLQGVEVPAALDAVFQRMVAKEPGDRQQSMTEVVAELQSALSIDGAKPRSELSEFIAGIRASQMDAGAKGKFSPSAVGIPETVEFKASAEHPGHQSSKLTEKAANGTTSVAVIERHTQVMSKKEIERRRARRATIWIAAVVGAVCIALLLVVAVMMLPTAGPPGPRQPAAVSAEAGKASEHYTFGRDETRGYALKLSGENSYCEVESVSLDGTTSFTLEVWTTAESERAGALISQSDSSGGVMLRQDADGHWALLFRDIEGWKDTSSSRNSDVKVGQRQHVAFVFDVRVERGFVLRTASLFIDGDLHARKPVSGSGILIPTGSTLRIGAGMQSDQIGLFYDGTIDDLRISDTARYTDTYSPESRLEADRHTMVLYNFDDPDGTVARDAAGENDGKLYNCELVPVYAGAE